MHFRPILAFLLAAAVTFGSVPALATSETDLPEPSPAETELPVGSAGPAAPVVSEAKEPDPDLDWVPGRWYYSTLVKLCRLGVNCVWDDGYLHPDQPLTRYDFLRLLNRTLGLSVPEGSLAVTRQNHLAAAVEAGLIAPEDCTDENLDGPFTRFDMTQLLVLALEKRGEAPPSASAVSYISLFLRDYDSIPQEYRPAVERLYAQGLLRGSNGAFHGEQTPTRAEGLSAALRLAVPAERLYPLPSFQEDAFVPLGDLFAVINLTLDSSAGGADRAAALRAARQEAARSGYLPEGSITTRHLEGTASRWELAAMLERLLTARGDAGEDPTATRLYLEERNTASSQALSSAAVCICAGVLTLEHGGAFNGHRSVTWGELYQSLTRLIHPSARVAPTLDGFTQVLSSFTTTFDDTTNSAFNIKHAAQLIGERTLQPGETLDFNALTGPADNTLGYKMSTVLYGGKYVPGWGGGVCQTSTTLFNAALLANLDILERHNHSLKSAYVDYGRDATISHPTLNLRFRNPYSSPIKVAARWGTGTVTFYILAPAGVSAPKVALTVTKTGSHTYTLTRTANGVANYTCESTYRN